jgi:hypothetical protein
MSLASYGLEQWRHLMSETKKIEEMGCKHRYVQTEKEDNGYWFKCVYCNKRIFGSVSYRNRRDPQEK